jgi:hypothetical protein
LPVVTPVATDPVYPGGPLSATVQQAIRDYMDTLGPARGAGYDPTQYWDDTCRLSRGYDAIADVPGVLDSHIAAPAVNVTPTDHAPLGTVDLLVYGEIVVRP